MKNFKTSLFLIIALATLLFNNTIKAQSVISTTPQNKNFLIEKGTGSTCSSCPKLDSICEAVVLSHPKQGILIEYHVGPDARPQIGLADYTSKYGDSMYNTLPFTYNMMVNRYDQGLPYGYTYVFNQVQVGADDAITQAAPVNLAMSSTFNNSTRELTIKTQAYYTANARTSRNFLNLLITEDSLVSKQTDARVTGLWVNNYVHDHVFRTNLTGYWGDTISSTSKSSTFSKTYSYTLPTKYNFKKCHLILFITEDKNSSGKQSKAGDIINVMQIPMDSSAAAGIEQNVRLENISISPNPSTGLFVIENYNSGKYNITVTDMLGKTVYSSANISSTHSSIDLSPFKNGIYIVKVYTNEGVAAQKVILAR